MKRVIANSSNTKDAQMVRSYEALCSLCDSVENMDEIHQDVFEIATGITLQSLMDAKYDLYHEMNPEV